jgi:hypothetical protein
MRTVTRPRPFVHEVGLPPELPGGDESTGNYESRRRAAVGADLPVIPPFSAWRAYLLAALPPIFGFALLVLVCHIVSIRYSSFPSPLQTLQQVVAASSDPMHAGARSETSAASAKRTGASAAPARRS